MASLAEKVLKSIVRDPASVVEHSEWGFCINVNLPSLWKIGLIEKNSNYELSLFFADTQEQSRVFYKQDINIDKLHANWSIVGNFHLSTRHSNLIWFETALVSAAYIQFWKDHIDLLFQRDKEGAIQLLSFLQKENIIVLNDSKTEELDTKVRRSGHGAFNVCAGLGVTYEIDGRLLGSLYNDDKFKHFLISRINEGLSLINVNGNDFLLDFSNEAPLDFEGDPPGL